ncbi:hypothetical protein M153_6143000748 [Pseudoloma neurophilia]|uniref:Uncharacterized protein n=1 Tax=Pseudoloma neurophilia TaxID=146866 RepID=A0A0R0LSX7_9MICR|nr:hypothetical protein M153_6143000748 [Pseudoloma neurophilia]
MVHYKIMKLLSENDTFGLFFNDHNNPLGEIFLDLSKYKEISELENDILKILNQFMTETTKNNFSEKRSVSIQINNQNDNNMLKKNFLHSIYYSEADRLSKLVLNLFSQIRDLNFNFEPDYTEKIIQNYKICWKNWNRDLGVPSQCDLDF